MDEPSAEDIALIHEFREAVLLEEVLELAEVYAHQFEKKYGVQLVEIRESKERGFLEPIFFFSDQLACYTLDGLIGSLLDWLISQSLLTIKCSLVLWGTTISER